MFVRALGEHCRKLGVRIHEQTAVTGMLKSGDKTVGVQTSRGPVNAQMVIWATGSWSTLLNQYGVNVPIKPMRLGVLMTEPVREQLNVVAMGPLCAKQYQMMRDLPSFDERHFTGGYEDPAGGHEYLDVMVQTLDGSLQVGNPEDYTGTFNAHTTLIGTKMMVDSLLEKWPRFNALGVTGLWSGLLPVTPDALPIVDALPGHEGVLLAAGHVFGNAAGPSTARLLAEMVAGDEPSLDVSQLAFDRPGLSLGEEAIRW
jgi:glycine/D-amino acid oxidase-like deaminating enzyme